MARDLDSVIPAKAGIQESLETGGVLARAHASGESECHYPKISTDTFKISTPLLLCILILDLPL